MLFNSYTFFFYLLVFSVVYFSCRQVSHRGSKFILLAFSYVFYAWTYPPYLLLLLTTTVVDYVCALKIDVAPGGRSKRNWLVLTLVINLGLLAYFKYGNFFLDNLAILFGREIGRILNVVLPVGISFYTFESLAYTIDVYRGRLKPEREFWDYALFIAFFPHLIAGPIVRPAGFLSQLKERRRIVAESFCYGIFLAIFGYFLKVVVADNLAVGVDNFFRDPSRYSMREAWYYVYSYALQIFGDFAGYSYIAIGLAKAAGYELPQNFNAPYLAESLTEFWRRWHISLSTWLRDYLYIPLGGGRSGRWRTDVNLMATMLLGGLWHGASWNFVIWGGAHGAGLVVEKRLMNLFPAFYASRHPLLRLARAALTFHLVCLAWIFFRAPNFEVARTVLRALFFGGQWNASGYFLGRVAFVFGLIVLGGSAMKPYVFSLPWIKARQFYTYGLVALALFYFCFSFGITTATFIYFQF